MLFLIDVDNKERFKIKNTILDFDVKELAKSIKGGEKDVHIDIKGLGVIVIDDVIIDYPTKAVIFKTSLILDYREDQDYDWMMVEETYWTSHLA